MRTLARTLPVLLPLAFGLAAGPAQSARVDETFVGPPTVTQVGCDVTREWSGSYVAGVIRQPEIVVVRMGRRFQLTPDKICASEPSFVERFALQAQHSKRDAEEPDQALLHRRLSYLDESGTIKPNGLFTAITERQANVAQPTTRLAGVTPSSWTNLGPFTVGGRVRAIAPHPTIANRIIAGSVSGGIWKTTDGGASWTTTTANQYMANVAIACLVHDPSNANTMYACTGEGSSNVDAIRGLGIFKSTDAGETWTQLSSTNPGAAGSQWYYVNRIAVHPTNSNVILAATNTGLYRSADAGASWTRVYGDFAGDGGYKRRTFDVKFNNTGGVAVLGEHSHYDVTLNNYNGGAAAYSLDGGATWTRVPIAAAPMTNSYGRVEIAYSQSTGYWYAMIDHDAAPAAAPAMGGALYKSTNNGATWSFVSHPVFGTAPNQYTMLQTQGWYDNTIWVAPNDDNKIIVGGVGIFMSVNGGITFTAIGNSVHVDHHALVSDPNYATNGVVYNGNDGGIYKFTSVHTTTTPSGTAPAATNLNNGLAITQFYGGAGGTVPQARLTGGTQDNGTHIYNFTGNVWRQVAGGDGGESAVDPADSNYSFGEYQYVQIHRNMNGGATSFGSEAICQGAGANTTGILDSPCGAPGVYNTNFIAPLAIDPTNGNYLYAGAASLWRTSNAKATPASAVSWSAIKAPAGTGWSNYISMVAVAPSNPEIVWIGLNNGNVYRSTNAKTSATPTWTGNLSPVSGRQVLRIMIDPADAARVYVTYGGFTSDNVRMTSNGLDATPTWVNRSGTAPNALPSAPVRALARHPTNNLWLYAGTEVGVFTTEDGGVTWNATNDGPGTVSTEELFFLDPSTLIAATHGRGMFSATVAAAADAPGVIQFSPIAATGQEGDTVTLTLQRLSGNFGAVSVTLNTANGTATAPADYTAISGQVVSWANGDNANKTVTVNLATDALTEGAETFTATISAPTGGATVGTSSTATITVVDPEAFPPACQVPAGWTTPAGAAAGWAVATDFASEGLCSLKSADIADSQAASIQFTGTFVAGNVSFSRRVSSETNYDCFQFYIDDVAQDVGSACLYGSGSLGVSGDLPFGAVSFPITAGSHTLRWSYTKDSSVTSLGDAAWIDNVVLPLAGGATQHSLTVNKSGSGTGTVTSSPAGINCGATCSANFDSGTVVTLTAAASGDSAFASWSGGGCSGNGTCVVTLNAATTVTANFAPRVTLTVNKSGTGSGTVTSTPSGIDCGATCAVDLPQGYIIMLTAEPASGSVFGGWSGGGCSGTGSCTISVSATTTVTATFNPSTVVRTARDMNLDGKADLVWRNGADGSVQAWLMNGLSAQQIAGLLPAGGYTVTHIADLNNDGKADLLVKNSDGTAIGWLMDGLGVTGNTTLVPAGSGWSIAKVGDLNGDGNADLIWQHTDGTVQAWLMNGLTVGSMATFVGAGSNWNVSKVADLNGDGKADLIWQHGTGTVQAWIMDGLTVTQIASFAGAGSGWSVVLVGDFNGDGKADLMWQHTDGTTQGWLMNGLTVMQLASFTPAGTGWTPKLAGDVDGDGKSDVFWEHIAGNSQTWLMNGLAVSNLAGFVPAGTGWAITHLLDLDGDQKRDAIWRHTSGAVQAWLMNGLTITQIASLAPAGSYTVVPPQGQ